MANSQLWKEFDWTVKMSLFHALLVISTFVKDQQQPCAGQNVGKKCDYTHFLTILYLLAIV